MRGKKILAICMAALTGISIMPIQQASAASKSSFISELRRIANDNRHGYSKKNRWGLDYDCSSYVITALKRAGYQTGGASFTGNMQSKLGACGFTYYSAAQLGGLYTSSSLKVGDILLALTHCEVYIGNNLRIGAHKDYDRKTGDSSGREISTARYSYCGWYGVLRYTGVNSTSNTIRSKKTYVSASLYSSNKKTGAYKTISSVRLRRKASLSSAVVAQVSNGKKLKISKVSGYWGKTKVSGYNGWIAMKYLTPVKAKTKAAAAKKKKAKAKTYIYKTKLNINIRSKCKAGSTVLKSLAQGKKIKILKIKNGWGQIKVGKKTGWVSLMYCKKVK